jgi:hypothetical protein
MTEHTLRLYAVVLAVVVFFLAWAAVAARPWAKADPRVTALAQREQLLRAEARYVKLVVAARAQARTAAARAAGGNATTTVAAAASAPAVRVVNLPPLTITRTS